MSREANSRLVLSLHELWNAGDLRAVERVYHPAFVAHFPDSSNFPHREGLDQVRTGIARIHEAFPDWFEEVQDLLVDGDKVVTRYLSTGTHRGEFYGLAPTGRRIAIREISIYRIDGDRIAEQWCMLDELQRLRQLGMIDGFAKAADRV
ncbi:MAG TPA: ester cyclase [Aliidongia sp.]|uniref:ester cyclase n=1 Tax=Aliidongia sp. TaxID=1914230 RepID=UPI002DDDA747|nr:ester cyclase [Aliidongia sp.]HEV2678597.1 ester cyclase [Aliidongia sp.]